MRIGVIGTGYVGLVTGACLADLGHDVCCIDQDRSKIDRLNAGDCPIYEPGLAELIQANRAAARLRFSTLFRDAVADRDAVFIAVGTPPGEAGDADLRFVHAAAREIAQHLEGFTVVVTKSTVPVGTGDEVQAIIAAQAPEANVAVVSNPEFLREGCALGDFMRPDRIVVGADHPGGRAVMSEIYRPLTQRGFRLMLTDRRTSELIKYASNAFLAVKISYINEISDLCEDLGADAMQVAEGMGLDARIGARFLQPGPGYGGSCFPKDTKALLAAGRAAGSRLRVVAAAEEANRERKRLLVARVAGAMDKISGRTVAVLGLAFKAGTDDMREAASLDLVPALQMRGAKVKVHDPQAMGVARDLLPNVTFCATAQEAAAGADAAVILTEWPEYAELDLAQLRSAMRRPLLVDFRNLFDPDRVAAAGLQYVSLGRSAAGGSRSRSVGSEAHWLGEPTPLQKQAAE